jgi:uncharacterized Zn finger protein
MPRRRRRPLSQEAREQAPDQQEAREQAPDQQEAREQPPARQPGRAQPPARQQGRERRPGRQQGRAQPPAQQGGEQAPSQKDAREQPVARQRGRPPRTARPDGEQAPNQKETREQPAARQRGRPPRTARPDGEQAPNQKDAREQLSARQQGRERRPGRQQGRTPSPARQEVREQAPAQKEAREQAPTGQQGRAQPPARQQGRERRPLRQQGRERLPLRQQVRERAPRLPADGIRAKSQRGEFGESWWARRWIGVLEGFGYGSRLTRGRTYARSGAVLSIAVSRGKVNARVQGSRATPYTVTIGVPALTDAQWQAAIEAMGAQALFAARLLAGEMPQEIERAFASARVPLFPQSAHELATNCSCPDFANPCKHIAAVYYLLGERFDEDPFLLFELRGRSKTQIIAALRALRADSADAEPAAAPEPERAQPLAALLNSFDEPGADLAPLAPHIAAPPVASLLLRRYGPSPADTANALHDIYRALTRAGLDRLFATEKDEKAKG